MQEEKGKGGIQSDISVEGLRRRNGSEEQRRGTRRKKTKKEEEKRVAHAERGGRLGFRDNGGREKEGGGRALIFKGGLKGKEAASVT